MASDAQPSAASSSAAKAAAAAVKALKKWKETQSATQKAQLLPGDDFLYLYLTLKKIPHKSRTNPFKIPLPHPLLEPDSEICLIIDDRPKSNLTKEDAMKVVKSQNLPISKVLRLSKLKTNYKPHEAKRKLCDSYDSFLVDRRIVHFLPKLLGKSFFKKKKLPLPLDLGHKNWKEQIERVSGSGLLNMRTGTCCVVKVAKMSMENEEITENVVHAIDGIIKIVPKGWGGLRSLHLKFSDSLALPVYQALPDVKLRIEGLKESGGSETGDQIEAVEASRESEKKNVKKKKGRIHEVRYMDSGIDSDVLESKDDTNLSNETGKLAGHDEERALELEKVGVLEGVKGSEETGNGDSDSDSDDEGFGSKGKKRTKGKVVKESSSMEPNSEKQENKAIHTEKHGKKESKKHSLPAARTKGKVVKESSSMEPNSEKQEKKAINTEKHGKKESKKHSLPAARTKGKVVKESSSMEPNSEKQEKKAINTEKHGKKESKKQSLPAAYVEQSSGKKEKKKSKLDKQLNEGSKTKKARTGVRVE